jgi:hypothetical protein
MTWSLISWHVDLHDEVGGVTGGKEGTESSKRFVDRHLVNTKLTSKVLWSSVINSLLVDNGFEEKHGKVDKQLFRLTCGQLMLFVIPLATFQIHSETEGSSLGCLSDHVICQGILEDELKAYCIDGDCVSSGIVLKCTSEESLREEETRDPVDHRSSFFDPSIQEINSLVAILNPRAKWFE